MPVVIVDTEMRKRRQSAKKRAMKKARKAESKNTKKEA